MSIEESPSRARLSAEQQKATRQYLLSAVVSPSPLHVALLRPAADGSLAYVSRTEAKELGSVVYVGRLSQLDKPFRIRNAPASLGGWGCIRYVANGLTAGQLKAQRALVEGAAA